ncbi:MAG: T9SS type A sorting domain-containing protein [Bacteroidetes bacterium]|nr:T9SS type A sorting domain-containing protein [Bacteroidota bacterium]
MKQITFLFFLMLLYKTNAQNATNTWYYGGNAGCEFSSGSPVVLNNGAMNTNEGCITQSDAFGNLLFYSDGITVYNANHVAMPNGTGLFGGFSASQSCVVVPDPGNTLRYYIFTIPDVGGPSGLTYSLIDMTLNGGLGDIMTKNVTVQAGSFAEKLHGVYIPGSKNAWVMVQLNNSNTYVKVQVTSAGVGLPQSQTIGSVHPFAVGCLKFSHDGKKVAVADYANDAFELFDFDSQTGTLSNPAKYTFPFNFPTYGFEFSEKGRYLYVGNVDVIPGLAYQYDMISGVNSTIITTGVQVLSVQNYIGQLQLAPNGKIYTPSWSNNFLSVINAPDSAGTACNGVANAFSTNNTVYLGMPQWIAGTLGSPLLYENFCFGDTTKFAVADSLSVVAVSWDFGDPSTGPNNTSYIYQPYHIFSAPGTYNVQVVMVYFNSSVDTINIQIDITVCNQVVAALAASDTSFCDKNCIDFFDQSQFAPNSWQWTFTGASPSSSTDQNPTGICYNNYGSFDVQLIACNAAGCDTVWLPAFITEFQLPATPVITLNGNTLTSTVAYAYQWFIVGDTSVYGTSQSFTPTVSGNYYVLISDSNGCQVPSNVIGFYLYVSEITDENIQYSFNPQSGLLQFTLSQLQQNNKITYTVYDAKGAIVDHNALSGAQHNSLMLNFASGIYAVQLVGEHFLGTIRVVKQ